MPVPGAENVLRPVDSEAGLVSVPKVVVPGFPLASFRICTLYVVVPATLWILSFTLVSFQPWVLVPVMTRWA